MAGSAQVGAAFIVDIDDAKSKAAQLEKIFAKALGGKFDLLSTSSKSADQLTSKLKQIDAMVSKIGSRPLFDLSDSTKQLDAFEAKLDNVNKKAQSFKLNSGSNSSGGGGGAVSGSGSNALSNVKSGLSQVSGDLGLGSLSSFLSAAGPLAAVGAAAKVAIDGLNALADKAKDNSQKFSDGGGKFDQLSQALERAKNSADKLANSAAAVKLATLQADSDTVNNSTKAALLNSLTGGSDKEDNGPLKLKGDLLAQYTDIKRDRMNMNADIAAAEQQFDEDTHRKKRDLMEEEKETRIEQANKQYDLELKQAREGRDYQHNLTKLNQDVEFKSSNQKWELDRQFEQRAFQQKQQDDRQIAAFAAQDRAQQAAFAATDRNLQLNKTLGRNAEDRGLDLLRMGMSGASGMDYLFSGINYRKQQSRLIEDAQIEQGQANRNLAFQDFSAKRDLQFKQGTEGRDFGQGQQKTQLEHQIDLATHQYALDQQKYELTKSYNDAMADDAEAMRRLNVERQLTETKFKNREHDLDWDTKFQRTQMNRSEANQKYSQSQKEADFAGGIYNTNSDAFNRLTETTPELKNWNDDYRSKRGLPTGGGKSPEEIKELQKADMLDLAGKAKAYAEASANPVTGFLLAGDLKKQLEDKEKEIQEKWKKLGIPFDYSGDTKAYADGGKTSGNGGHLAIVHPGEYIINPNATDKNRQLRLLIGAGKELGNLPAFADGGVVGGIGNEAIDALKKLGLLKDGPQVAAPNTSTSSDDYAARFAAFADSLTHKSNAEENQKSLSSFVAGSQPVFPTKYWRPDTSHAVPNADPNSYLGMLQRQQNQAPTPPPVTPINLPGKGDMQPVQISVGNDTFHFNGGNTEQIQRQLDGLRQEYLAKIQQVASQAQAGTYKAIAQIIGGGGRF